MAGDILRRLERKKPNRELEAAGALEWEEEDIPEPKPVGALEWEEEDDPGPDRSATFGDSDRTPRDWGRRNWKGIFDPREWHFK